MTPHNSAASRAVFLIPKISHIIRHRKFVLQGGCFFLKKKLKRHVLFKLEQKNPTRKKFIVELSFFTSWTIANEKCTRAYVQENKSIYLSIYLSDMKPFLKTGVYIYIYIYISRQVWESVRSVSNFSFAQCNKGSGTIVKSVTPAEPHGSK